MWTFCPGWPQWFQTRWITNAFPFPKCSSGCVQALVINIDICYDGFELAGLGLNDSENDILGINTCTIIIHARARTMMLTIASTLLLVVSLQSRATPNNRIQNGGYVAKPPFPRCPKGQALGSWKTDQALQMRRSYSGGPPATKLSPRTIKSSSAFSTLPATEIWAGRSRLQR